MYRPTVKKIRFPYRGPTSSNDLNNFVDQVATDIESINNEVTQNEVSAQTASTISSDEIQAIVQELQQIKQEIEHDKKIKAKNGLRINYHQSMYKVNNIGFLGSNNSLWPNVSPDYGIAHLPYNNIESKFYTHSIYNGDVITPSSVVTRVTSTFRPDGNINLVNHTEGALEVNEGNPKNALNGVNNSYWIYEAIFPAESDITSISVELTVTVPNQNNTKSNMLTINPYPNFSTDILSIATSPDLTESFSILQHANAPEESAPFNNAVSTKYIFPPQDIDQVRIRLRTRNYNEENGRKVFRLGLQELGLFLVDFEKSSAELNFSNWSSQSDVNNISMVHRINAPEGMAFVAIHDFRSDPDITLETDNSQHIIFRVFNGDPVDSISQEIWNSTRTYPQNQPDTVGAQITLSNSVSSLYVVTNMRYVANASATSPFYSNMSPYLSSFSLEVSAIPVI